MRRDKHAWVRTGRLRKQTEEGKALHARWLADWLLNHQHNAIFNYNEGARYWHRYQSGCSCRVCSKPIEDAFLLHRDRLRRIYDGLPRG